MNKDNYVSPEVAQRLVENGIVLETDAVWFHFKGGWQLIRKDGNRLSKECIPSPCFAELWRELPCRLIDGQIEVWKLLDGVTGCGYFTKSEEIIAFTNHNPADALAELLIYVKGQEKV